MSSLKDAAAVLQPGNPTEAHKTNPTCPSPPVSHVEMWPYVASAAAGPRATRRWPQSGCCRRRGPRCHRSSVQPCEIHHTRAAHGVYKCLVQARDIVRTSQGPGRRPSALWNILYMVVTPEVSHAPMSSLKDAALSPHYHKTNTTVRHPPSPVAVRRLGGARVREPPQPT